MTIINSSILLSNLVLTFVFIRDNIISACFKFLFLVQSSSARRSVSASLSAQVTVSTCLQTSPPTALTSMNQRSSHLRSGPPKKFLDKITFQSVPSGEKALEANEIRKMAVNKSKRCQLFVGYKKKMPPNQSSQPSWWWWWWIGDHLFIKFYFWECKNFQRKNWNLL